MYHQQHPLGYFKEQQQQQQQPPQQETEQHQPTQDLQRQMYLQMQNQQIHQQWLLEQQQSQQFQAQQYDELERARQILGLDDSSSHDSTRKRAFTSDSDDPLGIKKRNVGSEATAFNTGGYPGTSAGISGSLSSNMLDQSVSQDGYFDPPLLSTSSTTSPLRVPLPGSGLGSGASAPTTPGGVHDLVSFSSLSATAPSSMPSSWSAFAQDYFQGPTTSGIGSAPGSTSGMMASMVATTTFADALADREPLEHRFLQEQKKLQEMQFQEKQQLHLVQQLELQEVQRHQEEQTEAVARARAAGQIPPAYVPASIHHDHNDPATWGYTNVSAGQFTECLGGYDGGYTPAAMGGVAALAAMAAASRDVHVVGRGSGGSSGMEMDP
ncbi:hypothetical protein BGX34_004102 [Mortierella sp. NVP85]|nr:hypothetical protein BGX34_004102 [Mortierella sp. NVP85]